ncbi:MAG: hypothetical protein Q9218_003504 [Villophora microphyllina]
MCPPGVDQTCRTPQRWHIVAPRIQCQHRLKPCGKYQTSRPYNVLFSSNVRKSWDAWSKLSKLPSGIRVSHGGSGVPALKRRETPLSLLERLPAEILGLIFDGLSPSAEASNEHVQLGANLDILAFGLTSSTMFAHCFRHIAFQSSSASVGAWAGMEIACTGTYLTVLPPSFTETGLAPKNVVYEPTQGFAGGRGRYGRRGMCEARKWNWSALSNYETDEDVPACYLWAIALKMLTSPFNVRREGEGAWDEKLIWEIQEKSM